MQFGGHHGIPFWVWLSLVSYYARVAKKLHEFMNAMRPHRQPTNCLLPFDSCDRPIDDGDVTWSGPIYSSCLPKQIANNGMSVFSTMSVLSTDVSLLCIDVRISDNARVMYTYICPNISTRPTRCSAHARRWFPAKREQFWMLANCNLIRKSG